MSGEVGDVQFFSVWGDEDCSWVALGVDRDRSPECARGDGERVDTFVGAVDDVGCQAVGRDRDRIGP